MTIIEIRPYRGGWQCFEAPGVQPYWTGETAKHDVISYAKGRAKFGRGEIRAQRRQLNRANDFLRQNQRLTDGITPIAFRSGSSSWCV
jgi:hypothetical protein